MRFSTIIAASVLLLSGANAQRDREYYCWGYWDWNHRPSDRDCGYWNNHQWHPYWFNQWNYWSCCRDN
ncbi:hypothetical protein BDW60DRAFT_108785 [Aspergillus nidulans var. acristatus]